MEAYIRECGDDFILGGEVLWLLGAQASSKYPALQFHLIAFTEAPESQIAPPVKRNQQPTFLYKHLNS